MCEYLKEYRRRVIESIEIDSENTFGNYNIRHAKCVMEEFIKSAQKSIMILSGDLYDNFYDSNLLDLIIYKKNENVDIKIITLGESLSEDNLLVKNNINIKEAEYVGDNADKISHFMVIDEKRYRLEVPHKKEETDAFKAEVCANGVKKAKELTSIFSKLWGRL